MAVIYKLRYGNFRGAHQDTSRGLLFLALVVLILSFPGWQQHCDKAEGKKDSSKFGNYCPKIGRNSNVADLSFYFTALLYLCLDD